MQTSFKTNQDNLHKDIEYLSLSITGINLSVDICEKNNIIQI